MSSATLKQQLERFEETYSKKRTNLQLNTNEPKKSIKKKANKPTSIIGNSIYFRVFLLFGCYILL
jgi:hypothetical protein